MDLARLVCLHPDGNTKLAAVDNNHKQGSAGAAASVVGVFSAAEDTGGSGAVGSLFRCLSLSLEPSCPMALEVIGVVFCRLPGNGVLLLFL